MIDAEIRAARWAGRWSRLQVRGTAIPGLAGAVGYDLCFWPRISSRREPDVLVTLLDGQRHPVGLLAIEVKLHAAKSSAAGDDDESEERAEVPDPDQLVAYWQGLRDRAGEFTRTVVYLTAHASLPRDHLAPSLDRCPDMQLAWLESSGMQTHRPMGAAHERRK
jgi:hypothetical protein